MSNASPHTLQQKEIVDAILLGGQSMTQALEKMYEKGQKPVFSYITQRNGTPEQAKDILISGLIIFCESVINQKYKGKAAPVTYLVGICKNLFWQALRKEKKNARSYSSEFLEESSTNNEYIDYDNPLDLLIEKQQEKVVNLIFSRLGDLCKKLIIWTDVEGQPMESVYKALGLNSKQTAYSRKNKCKKALRNIILQNPEWEKWVKEFKGNVKT